MACRGSCVDNGQQGVVVWPAGGSCVDSGQHGVVVLTVASRRYLY